MIKRHTSCERTFVAVFLQHVIATTLFQLTTESLFQPILAYIADNDSGISCEDMKEKDQII